MSADSKTYCAHLLRYKDPAARLKQMREWKKSNPLRVKKTNDKSNAKAKLEALAHYGKDGLAVCCWDECLVEDLDMLTLDHVNNDGASHRGSREGGMTGFDMYRKLRALNWPVGFQTLCWNHQWKKEILRRRS